jgi:hypothetical protein
VHWLTSCAGAEKEWRAAHEEKEWRDKQREKARVKEDSGFDDSDEKDEDLDDIKNEGDAATVAAAAETHAPSLEEATFNAQSEKVVPKEEPAATETATPTEPPTEAPRERTVYSDLGEEELDKQLAELKTAMDEASKVHQDQVAVKDVLKKELDGLEELFKHNFVGEHQLYGIFGQCFTRQITEYSYNLCWMDKVRHFVLE